MADEERRDEQKGGVGLLERDEERVKRPRMYRVIIHNDDFTPIGFVAALVQSVFRKSPEDAATITLQVHNQGAAVAGVYTYEIAETKIAIAHQCARKADHPLMLSAEPEE